MCLEHLERHGTCVASNRLEQGNLLDKWHVMRSHEKQLLCKHLFKQRRNSWTRNVCFEAILTSRYWEGLGDELWSRRTCIACQEESINDASAILKSLGITIRQGVGILLASICESSIETLSESRRGLLVNASIGDNGWIWDACPDTLPYFTAGDTRKIAAQTHTCKKHKANSRRHCLCFQSWGAHLWSLRSFVREGFRNIIMSKVVFTITIMVFRDNEKSQNYHSYAGILTCIEDIACVDVLSQISYSVVQDDLKDLIPVWIERHIRWIPHNWSLTWKQNFVRFPISFLTHKRPTLANANPPYSQLWLWEATLACY